MSIESWQILSLSLAAAAFVLNGSRAYWKAKAQAKTSEDSCDGWANEAKFWRRHFDAPSAEWVENL